MNECVHQQATKSRTTLGVDAKLIIHVIQTSVDAEMWIRLIVFRHDGIHVAGVVEFS